MRARILDLLHRHYEWRYRMALSGESAMVVSGTRRDDALRRAARPYVEEHMRRWRWLLKL